MSAPVLLIEKDQGITTLTLNRPERLNALSRELIAALARAFEELAGDPDTGVVILTGAGRAFCTGLDLKEIAEKGFGEKTDDPEKAQRAVVSNIEAFPKPVIGAINGPCVTGGFEIILALDVLFASTEAVFADTHVRVGLVPGWGISQRLPRLIGIHRAKELSLTGNYIDAKTAEAWGLLNRVLPPRDLMPACRALARDMLSAAPGAVQAYKQVLDTGFGMPLADALRYEMQAAGEHVRHMTGGIVGQRRPGVQARGRAQKKKHEA
ncbi:MAG: enoyl-CoA hydratase [Proteobacteria bacterium]|nr:enoyl-CoA hydratase [Pseudomonadota bacterium]